ncbi:MAG: hypothetical protein J5593_02675 [Bacteroidaceae bacterium]|nr:hypothetical protein [Bacteroidaceae bacterium]
MNVKVHTPKEMKPGGGISTWKQFLMALLATTISIALTFGTAAIIDHNKKQKEKREIVMMVMCDMDNSLVALEKADSMIMRSMDIQLQLAKDPTKFNEVRFSLAHLLPMPEYASTVENIFSSSIETINTVGNVLFTEIVADFYQCRALYKTNVCDSIYTIINRDLPFTTVEGTLDFNYSFYALMSHDFLHNMQQLFAQGQQMMSVSDEEIEAYRTERERMKAGMEDKEKARDSIMEVVIQLQREIDSAKKNL